MSADRSGGGSCLDAADAELLCGRAVLAEQLCHLLRIQHVVLVLVGFIVIVFGLTVVKVTRGDSLQGFDHQVRPEMLPVEGNQ